MSALALDVAKYRKLLDEALPTVIHDEAQNEDYISRLEALYGSGEPPSAEETELAELLTLLIENFEAGRYSLQQATPLEALRELMDANGLLQKDLLDVFGNISVVSEVLNGKRELSKAHIVRLAQRFKVSPDLFFDTMLQL